MPSFHIYYITKMSPSQQKSIDKMFLGDYTLFTRSTKP
nr:MAG TPA: hypothetical protein [Caudoviricetes sp.]